MLRCAGKGLVTDDFRKSTQVDELDFFVCHTWDTKRKPKFVALAMFSNSARAALAVLILHLILMTLDVFALLPTVTRNRNAFVEISPWCSFCACPLYWFVVFTNYDFPWNRGPTVFLDKLCVNQEDANHRSGGIDAIPTIINKSKGMVVVLTTSGLTKVWTMFEISAFLLQNGPKHLYVQPALLSQVCFFGSWTVYCCVVIFIGITSIKSVVVQSLLLLVLLVGTLLPSALFARYLFKWGIEINDLHRQAEHFNFDTALCTVEADRVMLKNLVSELFHNDSVKDADSQDSPRNTTKTNSNTGRTSPACRNQKDLQVMVADARYNALGKTGLPLHLLLALNISLISAECDSISGDVRRVLLGILPAHRLGQTLLAAMADISFCFAAESVFFYLCIHVAYRQSQRLPAWLQVMKIGISSSCWEFSSCHSELHFRL